MKKQANGTNSPMNTGALKRIFGVLVVLLMVSVLMVGVGSAEETMPEFSIIDEELVKLTEIVKSSSDEDWHVVYTYEDLKVNLTNGNLTKLGENIDKTSATDDDAIIITSEQFTVLDLNGYSLNFTRNAEMVNFCFIKVGSLKDTITSGNLAVVDSSDAQTGKINSTNTAMFFVGKDSALLLHTGTYEAKGFVMAGNANRAADIPLYSNPVFIVHDAEIISTADTAVFIPSNGTIAGFFEAKITGVKGGLCVASGGVLVDDTTISVPNGDATTMRPDANDGSADDGAAIVIQKKTDAYDGNIVLMLTGNTEVTGNIGALHNYIRSNPADPDLSIVAIEDTVKLNGAVVSKQYNGASATIGGYFVDFDDVMTEKMTLLLYEGLNQTGVEWVQYQTGGSYSVNISVAGDYVYKSTPALNLALLTGDGVKIDGKSVTPTKIEISGETSVKNGSTESITLTAKVTAEDNFGHAIGWAVDGEDILKLENGMYISGTESSQTFKPLKAGTATVSAMTNGGVLAEFTVTVYEEVTPEVELEDVEVNNGLVNITTSNSGNAITMSDGNKAATITTSSGVSVTLTYSDANGADVTLNADSTVKYVNGTLASLTATYPSKPATSGISGETVEYGILLDLNEAAFTGNFILPVITPALTDEGKAAVTSYGTANSKTYLAVSQISGTTSAGVTPEMLKNSISGVEVTFIVSNTLANQYSGKLYVLHVKNGVTKILDVTPTDAGSGKTKLTAIGDGFSDYILVADTTTGGSGSGTGTGTGTGTGSGSGGSSSSGGSTWLPSEPTQPTDTPTAQPSDSVPTDIPSTQPTATPETPGFGVLAVLAGLGAVAILRRK